MKKNIKYIWLVVSCLFISCENDLALSEGTIDDSFFSKESDINKSFLAPGSETGSFGGYMDLGAGKLYDVNSVENYYHDVDLAYLYTATSGNSLVTMDAKNISFSNMGEDIENKFPYKNRGELFRLSNLSDMDLEWFSNLNTSLDIQRGYDSLINVIQSQSTQPLVAAKRLTNLNRNEFVLFNSIDRKIKSIIYIENISASSGGRMNMRVKSDCTKQVHFNKPSLPLNNLDSFADTLTLSVSGARTNENYIDLLNKKVFKDVDLVNDDISGITLLHTFDGSIHVFYTNASSWIRDAYLRADLYNWLSSITAKPNIHLYRLDDKAIYTGGVTFDQVRGNNVALKEYGSTVIGNLNSFSSRIPGNSGVGLSTGMTFRVRDITNDHWGIVKVIEVNNTTGVCKIAYKYFEKE